MSNSSNLAKARLIELNADFTEKDGGKVTEVQFNPETLKVAYANQIVQPNNAGGNESSSGDQGNQAGRQFVGAGTTKLSLSLWFDVGSQDTSKNDASADVRDLTKNVAYFITPIKEGENYIPPAVRFEWGSFSFDGIMESLEETLEFFSDQGVPLRASMSLNLSQQRIEEFNGNQARLANRPPPGAAGIAGAAPGTAPLAQAPQGATLQSMAAGIGKGSSWQAIAEANGIENPRLLDTGTLINLNVKAGRK